MTTIRFGVRKELPPMRSVTLRGRMVRMTARSNMLRGVVIAVFTVFISGLALCAIDRRNTIQANLPVVAWPTPAPAGSVVPPSPHVATGETPG
jgi:hypothetical protein